MVLFFHFLGNPYIELDGKKLSFSLKKAEYMATYLALNGPAGRNQLKALFWPDMQSTQASANLRNALYLIRNTIPGYIETERDQIALKEFSDDLASLEKISDPDVPIPEYISEEPLKNFGLEGSEELEEWTTMTKLSSGKKIVSILRKRISICYDKKLYDELSCSLETLLSIDPYDEDSVLELMETYCNTGQPTKALIFFKEYASKIENKLVNPVISKISIIPGLRQQRTNLPPTFMVRFNVERNTRNPMLDTYSVREKSQMILYCPPSSRPLQSFSSSGDDVTSIRPANSITCTPPSSFICMSHLLLLTSNPGYVLLE